jgi:hypothetical protein
VLHAVVGGRVPIASATIAGPTQRGLDQFAGGAAAAAASARLALDASSIAAITRTSSNGSRAALSFIRTVGISRNASARRSGPEQRHPDGEGGGERRLRPEATWISPASSRAAAAQEVGPWISSPLRSAIPPRRST